MICAGGGAMNRSHPENQITLAIGWTGVVLVLLVIMSLLSYSIWHLPKTRENHPKGDES